MDDPLTAASAAAAAAAPGGYVAVFPYMFDPEHGPVILLGTLRSSTTKKVRQHDFGGPLDRSRSDMAKLTAARHANSNSSGMFGGVSALRRQLRADHCVRIPDFGIAYMLRVNPEMGRRMPALHASMVRFAQSVTHGAATRMADDLFRMRRVDWYRVADLRTASNVGVGHTHSGSRIELDTRTLEALRNILTFIHFDIRSGTIMHIRAAAAAAAAAASASSTVIEPPPGDDEHPEEAQILGDLQFRVGVSPMLRPGTPECVLSPGAHSSDCDM